MDLRYREVPYTSFSTGGAAEYLCDAADDRDVLHALQLARRLGLPVTLLGGGTNVLISDSGWPGMVLRIAEPRRPVSISYRDGSAHRVTVRASAATSWDSIAARACGDALYGAECLSGIPGTVGGAIAQNIGAYGQEIAPLVRAVRIVDMVAGGITELSPDECGFGYRTSIFNRTDGPAHYCITGATLELSALGTPCRQHDEVAALTRAADLPSSVRRAVLGLRRRKGMLAYQFRSAGSFFKNPVVPWGRIPDGARWWAQDVSFKVSAAWLVEQAGFARGYERGFAALSPRHALALVNTGGATAAEIASLAREIQEGVADRFGILLEPEVRLIGFDPYPLL